MADIANMEPTQIRAQHPERPALEELAWRLGQASPSLANTLPQAARTALGDLVRSMNCYYSNLIEGHNTLPVDIDQALAQQFRDDPAQRDLQLEALAHIKVQQWIDEGGLDSIGFGVKGVCEIHRQFYDALPDSLHWIRNPDTGERRRVVPGQFRGHPVVVGRHVPPAPEDIPRYMERWESVYASLDPARIGLALAAAHHRLAWIHPMADGNGRVARLITHAMLRRAMAGTELWSVSRGFARSADDYKRHLAACDQPRRGDLDGRGALSESSLIAFNRYVLETGIDQVNFMQDLVRVDDFARQIVQWVRAHERTHREPMVRVLEQVILYGEIDRSAVPDITGLTDRTARRMVQTLINDHGLLQASSHRAPLKLKLPLHVASEVFPGLIPPEN